MVSAEPRNIDPGALTGVHILLTYACSYECDHCFLYCSPRSEGTFTLQRLRDLLDQAAELDAVEWIYMEGGEPFLYYPLMLAGLKAARSKGFKVGIVSNCYWATCTDDAALWLRPLADIGIQDLSVSDDEYHSDPDEVSPAQIAEAAARELGVPVDSIRIQSPVVQKQEADDRGKGEPVVGGGVMFRGRAADKLTEGLPQRPWEQLNSCPYEELEKPKRVHIDPMGHVHVCQGISIGNVWERSLLHIMRDYSPKLHPICGPLVAGGPAELVRRYDLPHESKYVDECHLCFLARRALLDRFSAQLAPRQVYGKD